MSITQILDDRDPAILYSPGWSQAGSSNEFNATTIYTMFAGENATLTFQGIQISVHGTIGPRTALPSPQSTYSVDGSLPLTYQTFQDQNIQYNTRFYISPVLPNGVHTLVLTNLLNSDSLFLDYFLIYKPINDTSPPNFVTTLTVTTSADPTSSAVIQNSTSSDRTKSTTSSTGTIVAAAFAAVAGVLFLLSIFLWLRRRPKKDVGEVIDPHFQDRPSSSATPGNPQTIVYPTDDLYRSVLSSQTSGSQNLNVIGGSGSQQAPFTHQPPTSPYDPYDALAPPPGYASDTSSQGGLSSDQGLSIRGSLLPSKLVGHVVTNPGGSS